MGPHGEVPFHALLYSTAAATAGSAHGWVQLQAGANTGIPDDNLVDTMLDPLQAHPANKPLFDWMKNAQTLASVRSYKGGFPLHKLTLTGGGYVKPAPGVIVLGLGGPPNNAALTFSGANIETSVIYLNAGNGGPVQSLAGKVFSLSTAHAASFPAGTAGNPASLSLTLTPATGLMSGSFTLKSDPDPTDHTPPVGVLSRPVKFTGLLVPRLGQGVGSFQLPQLPADAGGNTPKTTLATSPQHSGRVVLGKPAK